MNYVLEWSQRTNNFHIQEIAITAKNNLERFYINKAPNDYHVIFTGTLDECREVADKCRYLIIEREKKRNE